MSAAQAIPFDRLELSKKNVRRVRPGESPHKPLVTSIRRHGVLQNLVVAPLNGTPDSLRRSGQLAPARRGRRAGRQGRDGSRGGADVPGAGRTPRLPPVADGELPANRAVAPESRIRRLRGVGQGRSVGARHRAQRLAIGEKPCGSEWKVQHARDRKGALVDELDALSTDEAVRESLDPTIRDRIDARLPAKIRD